MSDQFDGLAQLNQELLALNQKTIVERLTEIEARLANVERLALGLTHINGIGLARAGITPSTPAAPPHEEQK